MDGAPAGEAIPPERPAVRPATDRCARCQGTARFASPRQAESEVEAGAGGPARLLRVDPPPRVRE